MALPTRGHAAGQRAPGNHASQLAEAPQQGQPEAAEHSAHVSPIDLAEEARVAVNEIGQAEALEAREEAALWASGASLVVAQLALQGRQQSSASGASFLHGGGRELSQLMHFDHSLLIARSQADS